MQHPANRIFYPIAILLGIGALFLNFAEYDQSSQASNRKAHRIEQAFKEHTKYVQDPEATHMILTCEVMRVVGLTLTLAGVASMIAAIIRREKGWYLILTVLLIFSVLPLFLL